MTFTDTRWKHQTADNSRTHGEPIGYDLFDDEPGYEGQTALYERFKDGLRWPCRTINPENKEHHESVLSSWESRGLPFNDYRGRSLSAEVFDTATALLRACGPCDRGWIRRELLVQTVGIGKDNVDEYVDAFIQSELASGMIGVYDPDNAETAYDLTYAEFDLR